MFEILMTVAFVYLVCQFVKMAFRVTWGLAKLVAGLLFVLALPLLVVLTLFTGGLLLLIPLGLVALALGILKAVV